MEEVRVEPVRLDRLEQVIGPQRSAVLAEAARFARAAFADRVIWHVNATARGGGVAEMLAWLLAYGSGAGVANRWLVLDGDPAFFTLTKRLHNMLHGVAGDGGPLGAAEHEHYQAVLRENLDELAPLVRPGDLVLLHDPQTAGMAADLVRLGAHVVWRCHVGRDDTDEYTEQAWAFLREYVDPAAAFVFSRRSYAPGWIDPSRLFVIPPSIDPFSAKNVELTRHEVTELLAAAGLVTGAEITEPVSFPRRDGTTGTIRRRHDTVTLDGPGPPHDVPLVVQVSRWDRLKDMPGVMVGFVRAVTGLSEDDKDTALATAHLLLVGPETSGVSDDPEGAEVLTQCREQRARLPEPVRERIHLASLPLDDVDENAVLVNAIQRRADVVVQKSLQEGFGLTVAEAMWKRRALLASRVGGIPDQIEDGRDGLLLDDPADLDEFAAKLRLLLRDDLLRARLGDGAYDRVHSDYLGDRHLRQYASLFEHLIGAEEGDAAAGE
ncbi:glycosyltransferase [Nocardioides sp. GCM10027113]|uniref:glycosyltransferase n=1 Tax=unclassified Nocardioides TaxID=2615069 RepID=UPI0036081E26